MKILIAEDDRATRLRLKSHAISWGYEPVVAANGREGWELFQREAFPLVISDWIMPEMDGLELVRRIRSVPSVGHVFVILLTSQSETSKLVEGMEAGADDFVAKPFETEELRVRLRAGQRLVELEQRLATSNAELAAFASVASHDLREPLRTITSFLGILERDYRGKLDARADEFIGFIMDAAARMRALIHDLLSYARLDQGQAAAFETFEMRAIFEEESALLAAAIAEAGARVTAENLPQVHGDRSQISQLLRNLLGNAIKYRGDASPVVRVEARDEGADWHFTVSDNGIGIPEKHLAEIFQPFRRLHAADSKYAGSGVGLAICQKVIARHGGRLWVESEEGKGSIFHFTLAKAPAVLHP